MDHLWRMIPAVAASIRGGAESHANGEETSSHLHAHHMPYTIAFTNSTYIHTMLWA
jgi:hypothetical protein